MRPKRVKWVCIWVVLGLTVYVAASGPEYYLWRKGYISDGVFDFINYPLIKLSETDSIPGSVINTYWSDFFMRARDDQIKDAW
jgi:hypothetical protein